MSTSGQQEYLRQIVERRRSCRAFLPEPVPEDTITAVLETAQHSPSWCNTQPWQLTITSGTGTDAFRAALLHHVDGEAGRPCESDIPRPTGYTGRRLARRRECGWALYESVGVTRGDENALHPRGDIIGVTEVLPRDLGGDRSAVVFQDREKASRAVARQ